MRFRDEGKEIESNAFISRMSITYKEFKDAFDAFLEEECAHRAEMLYKDLKKYYDQCEERIAHSSPDEIKKIEAIKKEIAPILEDILKIGEESEELKDRIKMVPAPYSHQLSAKDRIGVFPKDKTHGEVEQVFEQTSSSFLKCDEFLLT
jgi:hypothetical protein